MSEVYVGIDLGGTNVKIGIFDPELNIIEKSSIPTDAHMGPETVFDNTGDRIEQMLAEHNMSLADIKSAGIGAPGPADYKNGLVLASPNMPLFKNAPVRELVSKRLAVDTVFENDANTACYGEFRSGAGKDVKNMVFYTLGTGVGGGIVAHGKLIRGASDNAAELGHVIIYPNGRKCGCGQMGCLEAYASANSTAKRAFEAVTQGKTSTLSEVAKTKEHLTAKDVYEHAKAGDKLAIQITEGTAEALALACINMVHTTDPDRIVFAGGMIAAGDFLLDAVNRHFEKYIWKMKKEKVQICFASIGEDAGIIGAAALAEDIYKTNN